MMTKYLRVQSFKLRFQITDSVIRIRLVKPEGIRAKVKVSVPSRCILLQGPPVAARFKGSFLRV